MMQVIFTMQEFTSCGGKNLHKNQATKLISEAITSKAKLKSRYLIILTIDKTTGAFKL
ncbi:MAG TPA: hypothetical protein VGD14_02115 [bacterium]